MIIRKPEVFHQLVKFFKLCLPNKRLQTLQNRRSKHGLKNCFVYSRPLVERNRSRKDIARYDTTRTAAGLGTLDKEMISWRTIGTILEFSQHEDNSDVREFRKKRSETENKIVRRDTVQKDRPIASFSSFSNMEPIVIDSQLMRRWSEGGGPSKVTNTGLSLATERPANR